MEKELKRCRADPPAYNALLDELKAESLSVDEEIIPIEGKLVTQTQSLD